MKWRRNYGGRIAQDLMDVPAPVLRKWNQAQERYRDIRLMTEALLLGPAELKRSVIEARRKEALIEAGFTEPIDELFSKWHRKRYKGTFKDASFLAMPEIELPDGSKITPQEAQLNSLRKQIKAALLRSSAIQEAECQ